MKVAAEKVCVDKDGNLVPYGDAAAVSLVAVAGQMVRESAIDKYPNGDDFFDEPGPPQQWTPRRFISQSGGRFQSTGDAAIGNPVTEVITQTLGASPENPYVVKLDQFILASFTGAGQFDLVERDAVRRVFTGVGESGSAVVGDPSGVMNWQAEDEGKIIKVKEGTNPPQYFTILSVEDEEGITLSGNISLSDDLTSGELTLEMEGESETTLATKAGFADGETTGGWSRFAKTVTDDKVYLAVFAPGTAGDGIFSSSVQSLREEK